jgi:hypothetical protein
MRDNLVNAHRRPNGTASSERDSGGDIGPSSGWSIRGCGVLSSDGYIIDPVSSSNKGAEDPPEGVLVGDMKRAYVDCAAFWDYFGFLPTKSVLAEKAKTLEIV